jgi:hypothetical protein
MLDYIILVVTYNRVERCFKKTLTMLKENKVPKDIIHLVVHNKEQKEAYEKGIPKEYYNLLPPMIPIFTIIEEIPKYYYKEFNNNNKGGEKVLKIKRTKQIITQNKSLLELFKNQ